MSDESNNVPSEAPCLVDAQESGVFSRPGARLAIFGEQIRFSTRGLEDYFYAEWNQNLVDLLVVAAAVEFCDLTLKRPAFKWSRSFDVRIAVHVPDLWNSEPVQTALKGALTFLTGDQWVFRFVERGRPEGDVGRRTLALPHNVRLIMPYSDGLDSRAVAAIVKNEGGGEVARVRLGSGGVDKSQRDRFMTVPYEVKVGSRERKESSARSRGFKFAVITGIAAKLAGVERIVVTESGQGCIGPVVAVSGQGYPDYRVHPAFTLRVEKLFAVLGSGQPRYEFPRIWATKGETLREAKNLISSSEWERSRSCWQSSRQVGFERKRRQCGICAACMLRRLSMHTAGIEEGAKTYIWSDLSAPTFEAAVLNGFDHVTKAQREYAIAGILHLDHLADLSTSQLHQRSLKRVIREIAEALGEPLNVAEKKFMDLLVRHRGEWLAFQKSLGRQSFVSGIAQVSPWH